MAKSKPDAVMPRRSSRLIRRALMRESRVEATLLGLPTELRLYIYENLLPETVDEYDDGFPCQSGRAEDCELSLTQTNSGFCGYPALLLTCRTIYSEAVDMLYAPITKAVNGSEKDIPELFVSAYKIRLTKFPGMFCRRHLFYRDGAASIFGRIRSLDITFDCTYEKDDEGYLEYGEYDNDDDCSHPPPIGLGARCQVIDNIRWVISQLERSGSLEYLSLSLHCSNYCDGVFTFTDVHDSSWLLDPFKALRNVKKLRISSLGTSAELILDYGEEFRPRDVGDWRKVVAKKKKMREILEMRMQPSLEEAVEAYDLQDKAAFEQAVRCFEKAWEDDKKQRQQIDQLVAELRKSEYHDVSPGQHREIDPEGMEFSEFSWDDSDLEEEDKARYRKYGSYAYSSSGSGSPSDPSGYET
ncbi:hypothetical protein SLS56_011633 [Neofusicoccum ribis]|uniref:Uncharacterized protein n=1 Tax=Neofusicoccum ribis TaxID=45134 RepID=A0ABR3SB51_9PEZI